MISLILIFFAAIFNAIMDNIKTSWTNSIFSNINNKKWVAFANPIVAYKNKWKNRDIKQGEKFFGSSTFLVWSQDFWHFAKMLMLFCFAFSICLYIPLTTCFISSINAFFSHFLDGIIYLLVYTITFEIFYSKVFTK